MATLQKESIMKRIYKNLIKVDVIKKFMRENGLGIKKLSQLSGVSLYMMRVILSGNSSAGLTHLLKIARVMGVNFVDLLNDKCEIELVE